MEEEPIGFIEQIKMKRKKILLTLLIITIIIVLAVLGFGYVNYTNNKNYNLNISNADQDFKADKFVEAKQQYNEALKYKVVGTVKTKLILCDVVSTSFDTFNKAIGLLNDKNYIDAYNTFRRVIPQDVKRYTLAQSKAKDSLKLYTDVKTASAKVFADKTDFTNAIGQLNEIPTIDGDNATVKTLMAQYQVSLQKKNDAEAAAAVELKREQDEQANQIIINNIENAIRVKIVNISTPNSAGGIDMDIIWTNKSSKVIKYVTFEVVPYNAVNDAQTDEISGKSNFRGKVTGPIPGNAEEQDSHWSCAWYNNTITLGKIIGVNIIYMDDSTISIDESNIMNIFY